MLVRRAGFDFWMAFCPEMNERMTHGREALPATCWTTPSRASTAPSRTSIPTSPRSSISQGTLTITFLEKQRLMLTPQPSPRQLWVAFRDRAWHFDWDETRATWLDDRGQGVDLYELLEATTRDVAKVSIKIART